MSGCSYCDSTKEQLSTIQANFDEYIASSSELEEEMERELEQCKADLEKAKKQSGGGSDSHLKSRVTELENAAETSSNKIRSLESELKELQGECDSLVEGGELAACEVEVRCTEFLCLCLSHHIIIVFIISISPTRQLILSQISIVSCSAVGGFTEGQRN